MSIAPLPKATRDVLRSTVVLVDSVSVVKELIDNALDARATSIAIEISANSVDVIQVKDNGTGVAPEDRELLCKRGCTSKIRSYEDLANLGGEFLGFRGEALSSIAEMSESVIVTTRVDGELAGTACTFDFKGSLISTASKSHPVGTTVRLSSFLSTIPVRKQAVTKQAAQILTKIKRLLFSYAFARPCVKFSLKVLRSKSDMKANWSFAPCTDETHLLVLASKIVGNTVAGQCLQESICDTDNAYKLDVLLLKPNADLKKTQNERYITIDGRPLSPSCLIMKAIFKIYKSYLQIDVCQKSLQAEQQPLFLHLCCPKGSYDVNIEPAKDDILLEDMSPIISLFEAVCKRVYGELTSPDASSLQGSTSSQRKVRRDVPFSALMSKSSAIPSKNGLQSSATAAAGKERDDIFDSSSVQLPEPPVSTSTSTHSEAEQEIHTHLTKAPDENLESQVNLDESDHDVMDPKITNPFTLAILNTRVNTDRQNERTKTIIATSEYDPHEYRPGTVIVSGLTCSDLIVPSQSPNPITPYQNPGPPVRPWPSANSSSSNEEFEIDSAVVEPVSQPTLSDRWTKSQSSTSMTGNRSASRIIHEDVSQGGSSDVSQVNVVDPTIRASAEKRRKNSSPTKRAFQTAWKRASTDGNNVSSQTSSSISRSSNKRPVLANNNSSLSMDKNGGSQGVFDSELEDIMEFEHRKKATIDKYRQQFGKEARSFQGSTQETLHGSSMVKPVSTPDVSHQRSMQTVRQHPKNLLQGRLGLVSHSPEAAFREADAMPMPEVMFRGDQNTKTDSNKQHASHPSVEDESLTSILSNTTLVSDAEMQRPITTITSNISKLCADSVSRSDMTYRMVCELSESFCLDITVVKQLSLHLAATDSYILRGHDVPPIELSAFEDIEAIRRSSVQLYRRGAARC